MYYIDTDKEREMNKTIYLIRHGESEVNKNKNKVIENKGHHEMFTLYFWKSAFKYLTSSMDSKLTEKGRQQAIKQGENLKSLNFIEKKNIECIIHSPLKRTRDTCKLMFGEWTNIFFEEEKLLTEKYLSEYFYADIEERAEILKGIIMSRKEKSMILVGHSRIFQALIGQQVKIPNCSVWQIELSDNGLFSNLTKLYDSIL